MEICWYKMSGLVTRPGIIIIINVCDLTDIVSYYAISVWWLLLCCVLLFRLVVDCVVSGVGYCKNDSNRSL
jgi:hypothetical protein